jgi:hypothetical protein
MGKKAGSAPALATDCPKAAAAATVVKGDFGIAFPLTGAFSS